MKTISLDSKELLPLIEETLLQDSSFNLKVKGHSMRPFLRDELSSVILVKPEKIEKNAICLFKYKDKIVLHRLRKIINDQYHFIGDTQKNYEVVLKENIIAKVKSIKTKNKETNTKNNCYRLKVNLWYLLKPLRRIFLKILPR